MSNALKKKSKPMKPKDYENRFVYVDIQKRKALAENCFGEVFKSIQMTNLYVLYYIFDFSKQKIQNFNKIIRKHNTEYDLGIIKPQELEDKFKANIGFDCEKQAEKFPYRAKIKMYGKRLKTTQDYDIAIKNINAAIETYLILAVHTLHTNYKFSAKMIEVWWEECIKFSLDNYANGMKDEHVVQYFKQECDLDIE